MLAPKVAGVTFHNPSCSQIVEAMHALIESGRIHRCALSHACDLTRSIAQRAHRPECLRPCVCRWGTSNWSPPRIAAAVAAARANGWATPTVDAAQFSLAIPAIPVCLPLSQPDFARLCAIGTHFRNPRAG